MTAFDSDRGPDFLCIGAPRTGTTWLTVQLSAHPGIWIPPLKELHYFDRRFPVGRVGEFDNVRRGFLGLFPTQSRKRIVRIFAKGALRGSFADLAWSQAKKLVPKLHGKPLAAVSDSEFLDYLGHPAARERGDYMRTLRDWEGRFDSSRFFVGFHEEIADAPARLLGRVLDFLGVPGYPGGFPDGLSTKLKPSPPDIMIDMPDTIRAALMALYREDVAQLADRFGGVPAEWQRSMTEA